MLTVIRCLSITLAVVSLLGCQSTTPASVKPAEPLLYDEGFKGFELFPVETEQEVFALTDEAKAFVDRVVWPHDNSTQRITALIDAVFDRSDFNLLYSNDANTTASETFQNRAANCLSMSIMAYSLAEHAGFKVRFRDIQIPEYWTRRDGFSLLNGHVNVLVSPPDLSQTIRLVSTDVVVDFDPQDRRKHFPVEIISKQVALAMFYNNKGADALIADSYARAYAYFREAALLAPQFDGVWVNLGILYRRSGYTDFAEKSYQRAIQIDAENYTAWENLAYLYQLNGDLERATEIAADVERKRQSNPFYHFILGEQAFDEGQLELAITYYSRAYKLDDDKHEILFGLSKTYYEMGDINRAEKYLSMAKRRAPNSSEEQRYDGKLSKLQHL
ncbi:tetratricopeptide repeat protein [Alteromonas oceanisediminis]|uniref:tetratricopeptide repeat protein n=1 Tax=Alteromonas oceanisediminis TaxID=2836180 RepID=UPI001BDA298D|nr:tetratricopeptide repeat protein [Alteromonas oceanisediminis]MBT0585928.1 tetratricopeptide repeat protein [Alteromonas oceanisediminis]